MELYCIGCGEKTEYSYKKPILCGFCGQSFTAGVVPPKRVVASAPQTSRVNIKDSEEDGEEFIAPNSDPVILEVDFQKVDKETVGSTMRQEKLGGGRAIPKMKKSQFKKHKEALIEKELRERCASSKNRPVTIGGVS